MSLPLANQVRNVYVADTLVSDAVPSALGEISVEGEVGKNLYFRHFGQGGLTCSDKIDVQNIRQLKLTEASALNDKLGAQTITVTKVSAGQIYEVKLKFLNYIGLGAQDYTYRLGTYKAKSDDTAALIAAGLAASLQAALGLDDASNAADITHYKENLALVSVSGAVITVKEVEQYWELGKFSVSRTPIEIQLNGIVVDDDYVAYDWATIAPTTPTTTSNSGKKLADLEYFCMGNRADQYRGMGFPYTTPSKLMVDPTEEYSVIDIHYFFQGTGVSVQQSEKEITIIALATEAEDIYTAIEDQMGTQVPYHWNTYPPETEVDMG